MRHRQSLIACVTAILQVAFLISTGCISSSGPHSNGGVSSEKQPTNSTKSTTSSNESFEYRNAAKQVMTDLLSHYWTDKDGGHVIDTHGGTEEVEDFIAFWCSSIMVFAMESYYQATGDADVLDKIRLQWEHIQRSFTEQQLTSNMGHAPNTAADDAGWDALYYLKMYKLFGDETALRYAHDTVWNAFVHWAVDGDLSNGMWYNNFEQYNDRWISTYCAVHILVALEYSEITKGTDRYDEDLYTMAMELYGWIENHMRRDRVVTIKDGLQNGDSYTISSIDSLYWVDYNVNRSTRVEKNGPDGGTRPMDITDNGSVSGLFANMLMAAVNAMLYRQTGEEIYRDKAVSTANSMTKIYGVGGSYINDRDPYTNTTFLYHFITEVLPLEGITQETMDLLGTTASNIMKYSRTEDGYYKICWRNTNNYPIVKADATGEYMKMQVSATTANIVLGAALAEKRGILTDYLIYQK